MRVLAILAAMFLSSCAHRAASQSPPVMQGQLPPVGVPFTLQALQLLGKRVELPATRRPTIRFGDGGRIAGLAGVNRFSGEAAITGGASFAIRGPLALTKMAGPPEAMALEESFLQALQLVARIEGDAEKLRLTTADGSTSMELAR